MVKIVADERIPFLAGAMEPYARMVYVAGDRITRETLADADGLIIRTRTLCNRDLLEGTPVKFIATATIGYDHIDTQYCREHGIQWHHAPGCNAASVSQYIASTLAHLALRKGFQLEGRKIGIIGVGHVGKLVTDLVKNLGMVPLLNDPPREAAEGGRDFVSLEEISRSADFITLHVPLTESGPYPTYNMAGKTFLERLKKNPFLVNTARGGVVDSRALLEGLKDKTISGFAADVWENEPHIQRELLEMTHIATPHIAGYSVEGKANGTTACIRAASRFFGFEADQWRPESLPGPSEPLVRLATQGKTDLELLLEAILVTYDVAQDDRELRREPSSFEYFRNHYPVRREFGAYTVIPDQSRPGLTEMLDKMGFHVGEWS